MSLLRKEIVLLLALPRRNLLRNLGTLGKKIFGRNLGLPRWLDIPLRGLKYLLLAFFVLSSAPCPRPRIAEFMHTPYGLIADVKMLNFFRDMSHTAAIVIACLIVCCRFSCRISGAAISVPTARSWDWPRC